MSEYAHVEKPLLTQLAGLGWTVVDQGNQMIPQDPAKSLRASFRELILPQVFRVECCKGFNPRTVAKLLASVTATALPIEWPKITRLAGSGWRRCSSAQACQPSATMVASDGTMAALSPQPR